MHEMEQTAREAFLSLGKDRMLHGFETDKEMSTVYPTQDQDFYSAKFVAGR